MPNLSRDFLIAEVNKDISKLKQGKSPGQDNIQPEFVINQSATTAAWLSAAFYLNNKEAKRELYMSV